MFRKVCVLISIAAFAFAPPASAQVCSTGQYARVGSNVVHHNQVQLITQYAIPVGVPVSVTSTPYTYTPPQQQQSTNQTLSQESARQIAIELLKLLQEGAGSSGALGGAPADPFPTASANCKTCHSPGGNGVSVFDLSKGYVTDTEYRMASEAVLSGKMPKGKEIDGDVVGQILGELGRARPDPQPANQ